MYYYYLYRKKRRGAVRVLVYALSNSKKKKKKTANNTQVVLWRRHTGGVESRKTFQWSIHLLLFLFFYFIYLGLPSQLSQQRICPQCRRPGFDSWVWKIPWRRKWQLIPVFLPGKSHGQRSLASYCPRGRKSQTWQRLNRHHSFIYFFETWAMWMHNLIPRKKRSVTFFKK